jgi:hypothetical protein
MHPAQSLDPLLEPLGGAGGIVLTSPPAQKPRPAPVMTTAPTSGSPLSRCSASPKPVSIAGENAFSRSGRLSVSQAIPSSVVSKRSVIGVLRLPGA